MTIDNDDMFINDIFDISYEETENDIIDILEFAGCDKDIIQHLKIIIVIQIYILEYLREMEL